MKKNSNNKNFFSNFFNNPLFTNSPYSIFITDIYGKILILNQTAKSIFDMNFNDNIYFFTLFDEEEKIKDSIKSIKEKININLKAKIKKSYSRSFHPDNFQLDINFVKDKDFDIEYILIFLRSYGEMNELIDSFDIQSSYFYSLLNLLTDPIFIKDEQNRYVIINKHFENLFELKKEQILNKNDFEIFNPEEAKEYVKADHFVLTQKTLLSEIHWRKFNNNLLCFNTIKSPIISDTGKVIGVIGISKDITAQQLKILEQRYNIHLFKKIEQSMYNLFESSDYEKSLKFALKSLGEALNLISISFYIKNKDKKNIYELFSFYKLKNSDYEFEYKNSINIKSLGIEIYKKIKKENFLSIKNPDKILINGIFSSFFKNNLSINKGKNLEINFFSIIHFKELKAFIIFLQSKDEPPEYLKGNLNDYIKFFDLSSSQKKSISIFSYFIYDLIEKKNKEKILKEYSYNLELIQQTIDISYWIEDLNTKEINFSNYFSKLMSIPDYEKITRKIFFEFLDKNTCRKLKRFYYNLEKNKSARSIIPIISEEKNPRIFSFNGKIFDNNILVVVLDITKQKRLEQQLLKNIKEIEKAKNIVEQANELKSNFIAFLSHELRNMLTAISGISALLAEKLKGKDEELYANIINKNTIQTIELINNILDFSKLESKSIELNIRQVSIRNLCDKLEEQFYLKAEEKGLDFNCMVDHKMEDKINIDEIKTNQIIMNLLGNAFKFTEKGYIRLYINKFTDENSNINKIIFNIEDTGIGISSENISKIFKPFTQEGKEIYAKYGGTGLGLSICKKLVEAMNGSISVKSTKGKGSTFIVELPYNTNPIENKSNSDKDYFVYEKKIKDILNLISNDKKQIFININDKLLKEKILELLKFFEIKFFTFDSAKKGEDFSLSNISSIKKLNLIAIIYEKFENNLIDNLKLKNSLKILAIEGNSIKSIDGEFIINKPFTYFKLLDLILFIYKNK